MIRNITTVVAISLLLMAGVALAEPNQVGLNAKLGFLSQSDLKATDGSKILFYNGMVYGLGATYGLTKELSADFDITHSVNDAKFFPSFEVKRWDISAGAQYEFPSINKLVPYAGCGLSIVTASFDPEYGTTIGTTVGVYLKGGVDYFLNNKVAVGVELKGLTGFNSDIKDHGVKTTEFDPTCFQGILQLKYYIN